MRGLTGREKALLGLCALVIFLVANGFLARVLVRDLSGGDAKVRELKNQLGDQEMWLEDAEKTDVRERWLGENMPKLDGASLGKVQGDLLQTVQDELFERKIKIEQQSLQDVERNRFFTEVAVRLSLRGDESQVIDWLTTLQDPEQFQVIKSLQLRIDPRAQEEEPQAVCQITLARWYLTEEEDQQLQ
ncbi:MAG: hypothetical protein AAF236_12045 [Verrucomicrobiota bacterium]